MNDFDINNVVTLESVVKAAAMSLYEDYESVKNTLNHFGGRIWNEINDQYIGAKIEREILPVHKNLKTVTIPFGTKKVLFVGLINDCGEKIELENKTNLTGCIKETVVHDKCGSCNQDKDICEQLVAYPIEESVVVIDNKDYVNSIQRYFENGNYVIVKKTWTKDLTNGIIEEITTTYLLDMLDCGCPAPTESNIEIIKENCYDCYCKCYSSCVKNEYVEGGYRLDMDNQQILLNRDFGYEKVYIEYRTSLPRINGELVIPEICFESMVAGIIYKANQYKKTVGLGERQLNLKNYITAKANMHKIMCRISLNDIFNIITKIPKFDIQMGNQNNCGFYGGHGSFTGSHNHTSASNNTQNSAAQTIRKEAWLDYVGIADETSFDDTILTDRQLGKVAFKDGIQYNVILEGTPDPLEKQVLFLPRVEVSPNVFKGRLIWSTPFATGVAAKVQYYLS